MSLMMVLAAIIDDGSVRPEIHLEWINPSGLDRYSSNHLAKSANLPG